jgi:hypothetical protein
MDPFDVLNRDPAWRQFHWGEARDPQRVDLVAHWRAHWRLDDRYGPRSPWLSPRRWRRSYGWPEAVELEGTAADDPAWADASTALEYVFCMDDPLARAFTEVVRIAGRQDPAGLMLWAPGAAVRAHLAFLAPAWDKYAARGIPRDIVARDITAEVACRTEDLGIYAQETEVAKVQRAFIEAEKVRTGRMLDGEFYADR